jgi:hypothetical protein
MHIRRKFDAPSFGESGREIMSNWKRASLTLAAVCAGVVAMAPSGANAALMLDLQSGGVVITDNGAGDTDPTVGRIINTTVVGGFGVAITVAASNSPGTPTNGLLQVQSLDVQNLNPNPATLMIRVSDTNFILPGGAATPMLLQSSVGGTFTQSPIGDLVTYKSFADPANSQPAGPVSTPALTFIDSTGALTEAFSGSNSVGWVRGAGPYSLANQISMNMSANAQMNISGTTVATLVPEPAAFGLAASTLLLAVRRRRNK